MYVTNTVFYHVPAYPNVTILIKPPAIETKLEAGDGVQLIENLLEIGWKCLNSAETQRK
jgi:hypothetical protein